MNKDKYRKRAQRYENSEAAEIYALSNLQKHACRKQPRGESNDDSGERVDAVVNPPFQKLRPNLSFDHGRDVRRKLMFGASVGAYLRRSNVDTSARMGELK